MVERNNSAGFCGGAYGDEGKGRVIDEFVSNYAKKGSVVVYRSNGGPNTGRTVEPEADKRIILHQLPAGIFTENTTVISGKGMVIHPGELVAEIQQATEISGGEIPAKILIDEMAVLSLDTHRAYEWMLKQWQEGGKGSTGRGIAPAYADVLLRHPLRVRDLVRFDEKKIVDHYLFYEALIAGLGGNLSEVEVPFLSQKTEVGGLHEFVGKLREQKEKLLPYATGVIDFVEETWNDKKYSYVFEIAQAVGLDPRWGVYPDVTASDTTFGGIYSSTEGIVNPREIKIRAGVIKATYMSSVGIRKLPTVMEEGLANKIREDAHEYGATTRRPRGIIYLDLPALKFFAKVGDVNSLVLTHMDIVYPETPVRVCVGYKIGTRKTSYRPDQEHLERVTPEYVEFSPWSREEIQQAKTKEELPFEAKEFLKFISDRLGLPILMITTGPRREQGIIFKENL